MTKQSHDVRWLLRTHPRMSFAARVKLTVKAFRILRGWRITTRAHSPCGYHGHGLVTFHQNDLERLREANIHPWHKHDAEPDDYVLHEVLHVVHRALSMLPLMDTRTHRRLEEWTVRDTCKVMGMRRGVAVRTR